MDTTFLRQRALALWNEAQLHHMQGDIGRAIDLYSKSIDVFPTAEAYTYRGWAYSSQKKYEDAIEECKRAIAIDPDFGNPYNDIGSYLYILGRLEEAIEWLEKAKRAPRYEPKHFPYMNLARIFAAKDMLLRAVRELEQALEIAPSDPTCRAMLTELRRALH